MATSVPGEEFRIKKSLYLTQLFGGSNAGVAKLGQRRKVEGLVLSGPRVQIPSPAPFFTYLAFLSTWVNKFALVDLALAIYKSLPSIGGRLALLNIQKRTYCMVKANI